MPDASESTLVPGAPDSFMRGILNKFAEDHDITFTDAILVFRKIGRDLAIRRARQKPRKSDPMKQIAHGAQNMVFMQERYAMKARQFLDTAERMAMRRRVAGGIR